MKEEILPISFLRFLAAFGVVCVHSFTRLLTLGYIPRIVEFMSPYAQYGYLGVNLFFLISGFVITLSAEGRTFGQFVSARFIRLFPVFWICVSITTLFTYILSNEHISLLEYLANLTMKPSLFGTYQLIDVPYWTLEKELRFYCVVALILIARIYIPITLERVALFLSVPMLYFVFFLNPYHISGIEKFFLTILYYFGSEHASYFIAGILFYQLYTGKRTYTIYTALTSCYVVAILQSLDNGYVSDNPAIVVSLVTLFFGFFVVISLQKITNSSFSFLGKNYTAILTQLGAITYPLYLLHNKITNLITDTLTRNHIPPSIAFLIWLTILLTLIFLVNRFDRYIRNLWKQSSIVKNILERNNIPWLTKVL
jgi:peptidoglycan/LPS O-acetylase OafA/YrhL